MRRLITVFLAALATASAALAYNPAIRDIDIKVTARKDGSIKVQERWDVCVASGTEWYLVRENLSDIVVSGLQVSEGGKQFVNEGDWDVDRSIGAKAGRCGIVRKSSGVEICWGVGSYGDHVFDVSYDMSNAFKSLNDYDMLHMQFVSDELSACPEHVKVTVEVPGVQLDTTIARLWGFGYYGEATFVDGKAVFESTEKFQYKSSVISLIRLDKGILEPTSTRSKDFQEVFDTALDGAYFGKQEDESSTLEDILASLLGMVCCLGVIIWPLRSLAKSGGVSTAQKKKILGVHPKEVSWCRDVPFGGNLMESNYVLKKLGMEATGSPYASALILRMVYTGIINATKNASGKVDLSFNASADKSRLKPLELEFLEMLKESAGKDGILQEKEFSSWATVNATRVRKWNTSLLTQASDDMKKYGFIEKQIGIASSAPVFTEAGQQQARNVVGFKQFLSDFTLISERGTVEAALWQEYLVHGALYGIASKVAKELNDINPDMFKEVMAYDYGTLNDVIILSRNYGTHVQRAATPPASSYGSSSSYGGYGGHSSFGGGGGFSGGGHGGGSR